MTNRRHPTAPLLLALMSILIVPGVHAATLTVGPGQQFQKVSSAIAAARDGDVVQVQAGTYTNDFATVNKKISIVGVGGMARMVGTGNISNGKGIFVTNNDITFDHIEFSGAKVADANGAGIRYEGGNLTVQKCYFHDNQNGILANASAGNIYISQSEFARNGSGDGYTHGIYVNKIASLQITNSFFHDTKVGHHIKSRASRTVVDGNRIVDGTKIVNGSLVVDPNGGTASYSIDLPNGGFAIVTGNKIVQSTATQNPALIHFGGESAPYAGSGLQVGNNTLQNYRSSATGVLNHTSLVVSITGNKRYNLPTLASGPNTMSNNTTLSAPAAVDTRSPWAN